MTTRAGRRQDRRETVSDVVSVRIESLLLWLWNRPCAVPFTVVPLPSGSVPESCGLQHHLVDHSQRNGGSRLQKTNERREEEKQEDSLNK